MIRWQPRSLRPAAGPGSLAVVLILAAVVPAQDREPEVHGTFQGDPMYTVLPPEAIAAIDDPVFVTGEAAAAQMQPEEPVVGLARGEDVRAYSLWQLDAHEIVNDTVGGVPVAVTW